MGDVDGQCRFLVGSDLNQGRGTLKTIFWGVSFSMVRWRMRESLVKAISLGSMRESCSSFMIEIIIMNV